MSNKLPNIFYTDCFYNTTIIIGMADDTQPPADVLRERSFLEQRRSLEEKATGTEWLAWLKQDDGWGRGGGRGKGE